MSIGPYMIMIRLPGRDLGASEPVSWRWVNQCLMLDKLTGNTRTAVLRAIPLINGVQHTRT